MHQVSSSPYKTPKGDVLTQGPQKQRQRVVQIQTPSPQHKTQRVNQSNLSTINVATPTHKRKPRMIRSNSLYSSLIDNPDTNPMNPVDSTHMKIMAPVEIAQTSDGNIQYMFKQVILFIVT